MAIDKNQPFAILHSIMNSSNEPPYKHSNISAEDQPPVLTPDKIPSGYTQMDSGLLIKTSAVGNIASRTIEQIDQFHEIKEILHGQKKEALSGYKRFAEDLGEEELSEEDYNSTLAFNLKKWEADGSLKYLQDWLKQNPGHKVYMSASPNKVIARTNLRNAAEEFILTNAQSPEDTTMEWDFLSLYNDEEISGKPKQDDNGNDLPMQLAVWTNKYNLDKALPKIQIQRINDLKKIMGSISDQTIPQTLGHWYRLRESEDLGGVGIVKDYNGVASGQQLLAKPKDGCVPSADMGIAGSSEAAIWESSIDNLTDEEHDAFPARFIIS